MRYASITIGRIARHALPAISSGDPNHSACSSLLAFCRTAMASRTKFLSAVATIDSSINLKSQPILKRAFKCCAYEPSPRSSSYRARRILIKQRIERNVVSATVLIGSNPFNSGNEFHRTILIRAIVRVCSSSPRRGLEQREVGRSCSQFNDRGGDPPLSPTCTPRISRSSSLVPTWRRFDREREKKVAVISSDRDREQIVERSMVEFSSFSNQFYFTAFAASSTSFEK